MSTFRDFFRKYLSPPEFQDEEQTRLARVVFILHIALILGALSGILGELSTAPAGETTLILSVGIALTIIPYSLNRRGHVQPAGFILLSIMLTVVTTLLLIGDGIHDIAISAIPVLIFLSALILQRRGVYFFTMLAVSAIGIVVFLEVNPLPWISPQFIPRVPTSTRYVDFFIVASILVIAAVASHILIDQLVTSLSRTHLSDARLRALVENSPDFILEINRQGEILFINRFQQQFIGRNVRDILPADQVDSALEVINKAFTSGEQQAVELQTVAPDGRVSWDSIRIGPVKQGDLVASLTIIMTEITAQKDAEAALQRSENIYRQAIMSAGAVPYVYDTATRKFKFIGEGIIAITGYSASELMSREIWDALEEEGFPRGKLAHLTYEEADRITNEDYSIPWECDFRIRTRDGQTRWIADTSVKGFDEKSGHFLAIGIKQDITARKQAEAELLKSASRLELLHNIDRALLSAQSPTEIAREALTRIRQLIPCQRTSITLFDFEKNEATFLVASFDEDFNPAGQSVITIQEYGQYIIDELLQDKACRVDDVLTDPRCNELDKVLAQNGFRSWLYLPLLSQGQLIGGLNFGRAAGNPFTAEEESIAHEVANQLAIVLKQNQLYESLQIELVERRRAEEALRRSESIHRQAIVAAGAVPYALDHSTHKILFIGEGILAMTGYSASEMMDSNQWNSIVEEGFPRGNLAHLTFEEADRLTDTDHSIPWECNFRIRARDGQTRWIADTSVKSYDKDTNHLISIGIKQDITERKHAEELQEQLIRELERRNAELERFAYTLSHELKSPLITIRGFLGYLWDDAASGNMPRLERDFHRITGGTEKMLRLINELIELMSVGRTAHEFEVMPLRALVDEAVEQVREKIVKRNVLLQIEEDLPIVYGDHKQLLDVFHNLIENSIKFTDEQIQPKIEIGYRIEPNATQVFYVRDNGIGIDPRFNERIFGIFHKLDAMSEGTGIGLALVKRIIEFHGGRIWVESEGLGKGSTFCFTIPDGRKQT